MNNERYLFRGMRADTREWVYGSCHSNNATINQKHYILNNECFLDRGDECALHKSEVHPIIPETVGMWSGLTDKNGVKVFEGDDLMLITRNSHSSMRVIWDKTKITFVGEGPFNTHPLIDYIESTDFESIEVIGSGHDHLKQSI